MLKILKAFWHLKLLGTRIASQVIRPWTEFKLGVKRYQTGTAQLGRRSGSLSWRDFAQGSPKDAFSKTHRTLHVKESSFTTSQDFLCGKVTCQIDIINNGSLQANTFVACVSLGNHDIFRCWMLLLALCRHGANFGHGVHFILENGACEKKALARGRREALAAARPLTLVKGSCQYGSVQIYEENKPRRIHRWSAGSFQQHLVKELRSLQSTIRRKCPLHFPSHSTQEHSTCHSPKGINLQVHQL